MRRMWLVVPVVVLHLCAAVIASPRGGDAQDTDNSRISALETTVADQSDEIANLKRRVRRLEAEAPAPENDGDQESGESGSSGDAIRLEGSGVNVTESFTLQPGNYKVTATVTVVGEFEGFALWIYGPGGEQDLVFNELIDQSGIWTGSAVFEAGSGGDFYGAVENTTASWVIEIGQP